MKTQIIFTTIDIVNNSILISDGIVIYNETIYAFYYRHEYGNEFIYIKIVEDSDDLVFKYYNYDTEYQLNIFDFITAGDGNYSYSSRDNFKYLDNLSEEEIIKQMEKNIMNYIKKIDKTIDNHF